jgi:hypothetical protein
MIGALRPDLQTYIGSVLPPSTAWLVALALLACFVVVIRIRAR